MCPSFPSSFITKLSGAHYTEAGSCCLQSLNIFLPIPAIDENEDYKDKSKPDVSSIMKTQAKSDLIENLLTSPVKKDDIKTFVDVNGSPENVPTQKAAELESPMELPVSHSSLQLTDKYYKATASNLKEWSPDLLRLKSPFLSTEEKVKLEKLIRHDEEYVRDILLMKLKEPDTSQHLEIKDKQNVIGNALLVACQHDVASGLGKLELNLSWDILPKERLLTHQAHEKMIIPENLVPKEKWKNPETPLRMENLETQDDYLEMHPKDDFLNSRIKNAGNKSDGESSCHTTKESTTSDDTDVPNRDQFSMEDFDLQYDEQECCMDLDSSEDALKTPNEMQTYCDNYRRCSSKSLSPCSKKQDMNSIPCMQVPDLPFDSVDSFVMMRETKVSMKPEKVPGPSVHCGSSQFQRQSVLTPMSVVPRCLTNSEAKANSQKFISLTLSGMFDKVYQLLVTEAKPHVLHLVHNGILQSGTNFSSMRSDYTRFLLKEITARLNTGDENSEDELFRNILTVHILRVATDLLINCCFESTIVYIGNIQEKYPWLSGRLDGLRKEMFKQQFMMQQTGVFHPKISAVCREIQRSDIKHAIRILVPHHMEDNSSN
ncbi:uncharacterized protein LOC112574244 isoform X2 [Pomacea canaliculata]|uniref:uncharacterized protein LOC112574244 isoform X2 n=1 Tax=Pomacea canaliculata TaxID=400727 RepID=UPI000D735CDB|nr:uncharacterized protein LOC112574244 isoform X2 [Pomacea canaliculata]XP_025110957.1 uncharacterized protein LOC112574244 isoform X2 [Pomacea canaliculata]